jgi:predicted Zn-dependent protease
MLQRTVKAIRKAEGVHDWLARYIRKTSTQYYVIGSRPENRRSVQSEKVVVTVMNDHIPSTGGQGKVRGEAEATILPGHFGDAAGLEHKLGQAVFMARLADNSLYGLPAPANYPSVELADPVIQSRPEQVAEELVQRLLTALADEKGVRLSSAEAFVEETQIELQNSRGCHGRQTQTSLLLDWVLLAASTNDEMESHIAVERRRAADLDVAALVQRYAQHARDALIAGPPRTGAFPVVVSDEALEELLVSQGYSPLIYRSSAQLKYQRMTPWEVGASVIARTPSGDAFTMYSHALLPFGMRSGSLDAEGLACQRLPVIEKGVLSRFWAAQRYAEYLQIPATGTFGNMEIAAGTRPFSGLLDDDATFYHIVAFSAMSPDPLTGDFVGEIRLGYELTAGCARPIRGGSISGNLFEVLASAQLSRETVFLGDYLGPRAMRFAGVTVAGA